LYSDGASFEQVIDSRVKRIIGSLPNYSGPAVVVVAGVMIGVGGDQINSMPFYVHLNDDSKKLFILCPLAGSLPNRAESARPAGSGVIRVRACQECYARFSLRFANLRIRSTAWFA
jgi:hypothetical protein